MQDLKKGFLRGGILVHVSSSSRLICHVLTCASQTMLSILLGPAVAEKGEGSGAGGYADLFNMRSMTVPAIAFGAAIVSTSTSTDPKAQPLANPFGQARHALTTDSNFTWTTNKGRFSHLCFYHEIIKAVSGWSETEQKQLVEWWNGCVLSILTYQTRASLDAIQTFSAHYAHTPPLPPFHSRVLSRLRGSSRSMSLSNDPRPNSTAALMHQQQHGA